MPRQALVAGWHDDYVHDTAALVHALVVSPPTAVIPDAVDDNDRRPAAERSECGVGQVARPVASYSIFVEIVAVIAHVPPGMTPIARPVCTIVAV